MLINPKLYREEVKAGAHALRQEGLSQTQIGRTLGVPRTTVCNWLKSQIDQNGHQALNAQNGLANSTPPNYLVVPSCVEKFQPPDGVAFPLLIADPPWNISDPGHKRERTARPKRPFTKDFGTWDAFESAEAYMDKCGQWLKSLYDVAAPDAWLFFWCSYRYMGLIQREALKVGWQEHNVYAWAKQNPLPMFGNNNFLQSLELALVLRKGSPKFRFNGKGQPHNFFKSPQVGGNERVKGHDGSAVNVAQKPLMLMSLWVLWASQPGDWVLDAFAGTGTTTIAALQQGRNACAVEQDLALAHQIEARVLRQCQGSAPYG